MSYRGSASSLSALPLSSAAALAKAPTALEQLLEEINFQRTKEMRQLLKDDSGFVMLHGTTYWTDLFVRHFLFQTEHCIDCDDLLFFVRKKHIKSSSRLLPKFETEVDVFRKASRKLPIGDPDMDWEETVYLNLIIHQFDYTLTLAICTRTSPKELQVLRRHSQKVYASPSRRRMDTKAEVEEMTYPNVCFMVDNFNEVFSDIMVRDGEMVCVELVASDRDGAIQGVIFLGSIRYDALKRVYDARSSLSSKMAQRMTFGLFSNSSSQRVEFVRMKGPQGKGHAEMAVTKPKGYSGAETPTSEPGYCATDMWDSDWDSDPEEFFVYRHQRRLSDPSANINNFVRGGWKTKPSDTAGSKARSENEGLDSLANGLNEIEAGDLRDDRQFCVHSASITTTDASIPTETSNTYSKATSSSASTSKSETNTSATTLLKRLPPASSIISSFFPSCKSKHSGPAIPSFAPSDELEFKDNPKCMMVDSTLPNVPEDRPACDFISSTPGYRDGLNEKYPIQSDDSLCEVSVAKKQDQVESTIIISDAQSELVAKAHENKSLLLDCYQNGSSSYAEEHDKSDSTEECEDISDDEFEDCNSLVSEISLSSCKSYHSEKERVESRSQEDDEWSDAEDDLSLGKDTCNLQGNQQVDICEQFVVIDEGFLQNCLQTDHEPSQLLKPHNGNNLIRKSSLSEIDEAKSIADKKSEICDQGEKLSEDCSENPTIVSDKNSVYHGEKLERTASFSAGRKLLGSDIESRYESAVIEPCEEEKCKTSTVDGELPFTMTAVSGGSKTDFELCAHGVEMTSLCLLCLGYSINGLRLKSDCAVRLKSGYKYGESSEEETKYHTNKVEHIKPQVLKVGSRSEAELDSKTCSHKLSDGSFASHVTDKTSKLSQTLPRRRKSEANMRQKREIVPPHKVLPDGTVIYYWCDVPGGFITKSQNELDDGAYNPLWTMRGFTQTFHFWKENKRAQSVPLNAFLTYVTLPWWSIVKDILDHRESPILTF